MIITIDIGATFVRVASFGDLTHESLIAVEKMPASQQYAVLYDGIVTAIRKLAGDQKIDTISIGSTGRVSPDHTMLLGCAFLPAIVNKPIVDSLRNEFSTKVLLNNDAVCSAVGETYLGVGKHGKRVLYITISTGMGGAFVKKDKEATYIVPAEIGHIIVDLNGKICECGKKGCIGAYAHGRGLEERFLTKPENIEDMRIWEEVAEYLTIGVIDGATIFQPDTIVFSGSLVEKREYVFDKVKQLYEKRTVARPMPAMHLSEFGDKSVLFGALAFLTITNATFI